MLRTSPRTRTRTPRTVAVAVALGLGVGLGGGLVAGSGSPATAASDPDIGTQVLNMLCTAKAGSAVFTPFTISRCQDARTKDGFELERLICEGLLEGTFSAVASTSRPNRVNWFCFHGPVTP